MQSSFAERVADLIDEVDRVENESEETYLTLGRLFPSIMSEMERSGQNASASLDGFTAFTGSRADAGLRSITSFAAESGAYFNSIHDRDVAFLARINDSIARLGNLEDVIGRVRSDSEEMEIISLNAMTVALKSGNAGKAFSVITDELKRLSSRTIGLTEAITDRGRDLMECFRGLRDSLRELDEFQGGFFAQLDLALTTGYQGLEKEIREAIAFFGGLITEAKGVREPIQVIMQGVQLQDIIRQSLQHVTISLKEARKAATDADQSPGRAAIEGVGRVEELAFVAAICELSGSLVVDIILQLEACMDTFASQSGSVSSLVGGVEERRRGFVHKLAGDAADSTADARRFSEGSARYFDLKKKVIQTSRRLSEQVKGLDESFRGLSGLLSRFQNIVVASRIEVAKNRSLSGVANTVQGMIQLTDRIELDVGEAMDTTKAFIKVAYTAIVEYAGDEDLERSSSSGRARGGAAEGDRLLSTLNRVEADLLSLNEARNRVGEAIRGFLLYTPEFISLITEATGALGEIKVLISRLHVMEDDLLGLRKAIGAELGDDHSASRIKSGRLREMIDQFTIFAHKRTAGEIGSFAVEDGAEAGEVTLF